MMADGRTGIGRRCDMTSAGMSATGPPPIANCSKTGASRLVRPYVAEAESGITARPDSENAPVATMRRIGASNACPSVPRALSDSVNVAASPRCNAAKPAVAKPMACVVVTRGTIGAFQTRIEANHGNVARERRRSLRRAECVEPEPRPRAEPFAGRRRAAPFGGLADYVRHERERPMAITWELTNALPGDLYAAFAAAVA